MNKQVLFNRFIDLEFTTDETENARKVSFKCPLWGVKPNIAFTMDLIPTGNTSNITIKVENMFSSINIAKYKYVRIRAGYRDSLFTTFHAEIQNSYIEKPNPNGTTIFNCVFGTVSDMYASKDPVEVLYHSGITVRQMFDVVAKAFGLQLRISYPEQWKDVVYSSKAYVQSYKNALEMWTEVHTQLRKISEVLNIPPLYMSLTGDTIYVLTMLAGSDSEKSVVLDKVSSAYLMGGAIMVKAPWLPTLQPSALFKMDTRFFRGRMGSLQVGGEKKLFRVYSMKVGFSTMSENYMEVNATDLSIAEDWYGK